MFILLGPYRVLLVSFLNQEIHLVLHGHRCLSHSSTLLDSALYNKLTDIYDVWNLSAVEEIRIHSLSGRAWGQVQSQSRWCGSSCLVWSLEKEKGATYQEVVRKAHTLRFPVTITEVTGINKLFLNSYFVSEENQGRPQEHPHTTQHPNP